MSAVIQVRGAAGVHEMLSDYTNPTLNKRLQEATKAGAAVFRAPLKAEAGRVSRRMASDVRVVKAARERPATIVKFGKRAWFDHFVIGGTRDHGPRSSPALVWQSSGTVIVARHVRGVRPNPMIERVAARLESQANQAIDQSLDRTETA